MPSRTNARFRYQQIAADLERAVDAGTLRPGDRLPSVRGLALAHDVSPFTAAQALQLLEDRGVARARPQSGYYVRTRPACTDEPDMSQPPPGARTVVTPALLHEYIDAARRTDLIRLGAVLPEDKLFPAQRLASSLAGILRRHPETTVHYDAFGLGAEPLRRALARRLLDAGVSARHDDIIITDGCAGALSLALRCVTRAGDTVAIESPAYFMLLQTLEALGLRVIEIPTHPREGISLTALEHAISTHRSMRALVLMPSYSHPLGSCMSDTARARLAQLCANAGITVIENDIFGETSFGDRRPRPLKAWDRTGGVMLCSSFSKTVAPGLRVGWLLPGHFLQQARLAKMSGTSFVPLASQLALADFVASGAYDRHLRRLRSALADQAGRMRAALAAAFPDNCRITQPEGGFVLWIELPEPTNAEALFRAARDRGILIAPGPLFSSAYRYANCIRVSFATRWSDEIARAIRELGRLVALGQPGQAVAGRGARR